MRREPSVLWVFSGTTQLDEGRGSPPSQVRVLLAQLLGQRAALGSYLCIGTLWGSFLRGDKDTPLTLGRCLQTGKMEAEGSWVSAG